MAYSGSSFSRLQFGVQLGHTDFQVELFPLHSPLLRESLLVSFPPLNYMLKSSGSSYLISGLKVLGWSKPPRENDAFAQHRQRTTCSLLAAPMTNVFCNKTHQVTICFIAKDACARAQATGRSHTWERRAQRVKRCRQGAHRPCSFARSYMSGVNRH